MFVELGNVLKKVFIDVGKLFQNTGAVWLNERLYILLVDVAGGVE